MGAVLVWIHHLPHFKCCPEPPAASSQSVLLRSRDALALNALDIASYNARESDIAARKKGIMKMTDVFGDITYYLKRESETEPQLHPGLADIALGHDHIMGRQGDKLIRRHSIQVCDAHRRLEDVDLEGFAKLMVGEKTRRSMAGNMVGSSSSNGLNERAEDIGNGDVMDESKREQEKLAKAAIVADQNAKLSIFSTRPAIYAPMFNLLTEIMCTTALIYGALMISERANMLLGPQSQLYGALGRYSAWLGNSYALTQKVVIELYHAYFIYQLCFPSRVYNYKSIYIMLMDAFMNAVGLILGFFIYLCVLALGGPTGIAANPARDFAPRMAHFVLPIHGKGPSEFYYAWIPIVGPFIGGCLAAGLYSATQLLNKSNV